MGQEITEKKMGIVFVSSDSSVIDAIEYGSQEWLSVPFESNERTELKRHFKTCSEKEAKILKVDRQFGIPRLIIIDSTSQKILTTTAADDIIEKGPKAYDYWKTLK